MAAAFGLGACEDPYLPSPSGGGGQGGIPASGGGSSGASSADGGSSSQGWEWSLPEGFPIPKVPDDNPMSHDKVELGRRLFYDVRLSENQTQSCASCHDQALAFTDGLAHAVGSTGEVHPRSSMSIANVAYSATLTWANPVLLHLEPQAAVPIFGTMPVELGMNGVEEELVTRLAADPLYEALFAAAFPDDDEPIAVGNVTKALASFQRTVISGGSPFDRYAYGGDATAISEAAKRGLDLFNSEKLECFHCHQGFNFQDSVTFEGQAFASIKFHNTGLYNIEGTGAYPEGGEGLYAMTGDPEDMGKFRVPTLRNIAVTAPYMHDGSVATLDDVLDHYAAAGRTIDDGPYAGVGSDNPYKSNFILGFELTAEERADLHAFFESLTDEAFLTNPALSNPWRQ
ncbi:MAG: di-heme enzyme [Polyangiaceae bacterium]|nr:di-heme enzyme [Polyangiaceae bacterium]